MTRSEALTFAIANLDNAEAIEVLSKIKASVEKKSASKSGPTDEQMTVRNAILEVLSNGACLSVAEMMKKSEVLATCSTSKITGNITPMLTNGKNPNPNGKIVRSMDKKVAKFSLI